MAFLEIKIFKPQTGAVTFHETIELADDLAMEALRGIAQVARDMSREATITKTTDPVTGATVVDITIEGQPKSSEPSFENLYRRSHPGRQLAGQTVND